VREPERKNLAAPDLSPLLLLNPYPSIHPLRSNNEFDAREHTELDRKRYKEANELIATSWKDRFNPKKGWTAVRNEDGSHHDGGVTGFMRFDSASGAGYSIAHCIIDVHPKQVMAVFEDDRNSVLDTVCYERTYTKGLFAVVIPIHTLGVSDREMLYWSTRFVDDEYNYGIVGYSVDDDRFPPVKGRVRADSLFCQIMKEVQGSEGARCEVWRFNRMRPKFSIGLANSLAAKQAAKFNALPLVRLKKNSEVLVAAYVPPPVEQGEQRLTWEKHLWKWALEAALGVQYLHHHRYERERSERKEGVFFGGGSGRARGRASEASAKKACSSPAEAGERGGASARAKRAQRRLVLLRRKRASEGARARQRSERKEGVFFSGGSGRVFFSGGSGRARGRERARGARKHIAFCGGTWLAQRRRVLLRRKRASEGRSQAHILLRWKLARAKKACSSAAEAGSLSERYEGAPSLTPPS
jgi:hypothetical protein